MLKKLKQKKQLYISFFVALIAFNLVGFLPTFVNSTDAQAADCTLFDPTSPKTFASRVYVDKTDQTDTNNYAQGKADRDYPVGAANTNAPRTQFLKVDESITVYAEAKLPAEYSNCGNELKDSFKFSVWVYGDVSPKEHPQRATFDAATSTFYATIPVSGFPQIATEQLKTLVYFCKNAGCAYSDFNNNDYIERFFVRTSDNPATPATVIQPSRPLLTGGSTQDPNAVVKAEDVKLKFANGLKDKYRLLYTETGSFSSMVFGSNGLTPINLEWGSDTILTQTTPMEVPNVNWNLLARPKFRYVIVGLNYTSALSGDKACINNYFSQDCSNVIFYGTNSNGKESDPPELSLPGNGFNPRLNNVAWQKGIDQNKSVSAGQPLGTVEFSAVPIIWASRGAIGIDQIADWYGYVYASKSAKFTVEVFKTQPDIQKACENDSTVTDKSICTDPVKMRYDVGKTVEVNTGTDTKTGGGKGLFDLILQIITYIVVAITSVIYWIFSYVLVPVLNALIRIRPYRDTFVNVIYPGWLIMRNLANIAFIVALLVMGLRVLFQFDTDAGKTRGFIVRLILMALLVNFSLVIAQGIVAIADTIQSQFLPGDTKVIEALGKALMADPAIAFQTRITDIGNGSATASLFTPIMLLITSVAGFFAFVAITAFIAIRTVALWVFYLTSPFAYFGRVLEQTKGAADQWWTEFFKYVFMVPILVFFLNIAALMAGTLSRQNSINPEAASGLFGDQLAAGIEGMILTVISQAVVLIFLFAGMQVAMRSGTFGSKAVVKYAQQGFKNALTKWPGTAKDVVADWAARGATASGRPNLAKAITAGAKPLDLARATKKKWFDDAGAARKKRQAEQLSDIPILTRGADLKKDPLKTMKEKEKEITQDHKDFLADQMAKSASKGDKAAAGAAMLRLSKNGDFDGILKGAEQITGQKYSKDAAGLNKATKDMQKKLGLSDAERMGLLSQFDNQAGKAKDKRHYSGNVDYKDGKFSIREVGDDKEGKFSGTGPKSSYSSWVQKQVDSRVKMGLSEDIRQSHTDSMVTTDGSGTVTGFTDTQLGTFMRRDATQISAKEIERFQSSGENYKKLQEAFNNSGGLEGLKTKMKEYNTGVQKVFENDDAVNSQAEMIYNRLFTPAAGTTTARGRAAGFTAPAGTTASVRQNVTQVVNSPVMSSNKADQYAGQTNLGMETVHFDSDGGSNLDAKLNPNRAMAGFTSSNSGTGQKQTSVKTETPSGYVPGDESTSRLFKEGAESSDKGGMNKSDQSKAPQAVEPHTSVKDKILSNFEETSGQAEPTIKPKLQNDTDLDELEQPAV